STAAPTPQASITQPSNGQTLSGSVPFVATGSGATVAKITFAVDGQTNWTETGAPYMYKGDPDGRLDTTTLSNGTHTLSASAYGTNGQSTPASISVTVANATPTSTSTTAAPQVDVTTPSNGQTLSGSLPFEATASGATVAKVTFAVDGQTK